MRFYSPNSEESHRFRGSLMREKHDVKVTELESLARSKTQSTVSYPMKEKHEDPCAKKSLMEKAV